MSKTARVPRDFPVGELIFFFHRTTGMQRGCNEPGMAGRKSFMSHQQVCFQPRQDPESDLAVNRKLTLSVQHVDSISLTKHCDIQLICAYKASQSPGGWRAGDPALSLGQVLGKDANQLLGQFIGHWFSPVGTDQQVLFSIDDPLSIRCVGRRPSAGQANKAGNQCAPVHLSKTSRLRTAVTT